MSSAPLATPIAQDLPCMKCGYNLRTLPPAALCPECATPVAQSIEFQSKSGAYILRRLSLGAAMLAAWGVGTFVNRVWPIRVYDHLPPPAAGTLWVATDLTWAALLCAGATTIAHSRPAMSAMSRRAVVAMSIAYILRATPDYIFRLAANFGFIAADPAEWVVRVWLITSVMCATIRWALLFALLVAAWRFMENFACQKRLRILRIVTWFCVPLSALSILYSMFFATLRLIEDLRLYFPSWDSDSRIDNLAFHISDPMRLLYWPIVALIAWYLHRRARRATEPEA